MLLDLLAQFSIPQSFLGMLPDLVFGGLLGGGTQLLRGMGGPIGGAISSLLRYGPAFSSARSQEEALEEANAENEARYQEALGRLEGLDTDTTARERDLLQNTNADLLRLQSELGTLGNRYLERDLASLGDLSGDVLGRLGSDLQQNLSSFGRVSEPIIGGFRDREQRVLGELEGLGAQQRRDINRQFDDLSASELADLSSRGLGGSTVRSSIRQGVERERGDALGRLEESIRQQRAGAIADLSGDVLGAQERLGLTGFDIGRLGRADITGAATQFGGLGFDLGRQSRAENLARTQNLGLGRIGALTDMERANIQNQYQRGLAPIDVILGRSDIGPDQNAFANLLQGLGAASVPLPNQPSVGESLIGPAIGTTGSIIGALSLLAAPFTGGASLAGLGALPISDRNAKDIVEEVDQEAILEAVEKMPVSRWRYKGDETLSEHVGPMAQDFQESFKLGDGRTINLLDAVGILFAAVRALAAKLKVQNA